MIALVFPVNVSSQVAITIPFFYMCKNQEGRGIEEKEWNSPNEV